MKVTSLRGRPPLWSIKSIAKIRRTNSSRNADNRSRSGSISVEKCSTREDVGGSSISILFQPHSPMRDLSTLASLRALRARALDRARARRHFSSGATAAARIPDGVSPKRRRNTQLKWETSPKPTAKAISMIAKCRWRGSLNNEKARSSRRCTRCSVNDFPVSSSNCWT